MARSDLLVSLVRASSSGDTGLVRQTVEEIIAEERNKQHNVLADRLTRALACNGNSLKRTPERMPSAKGSEYLVEAVPRRTFDDLMLPEGVYRVCEELVEEQVRAELLRANGLNPRHRVLLVGPPGNGKTSLAEAIAEHLTVPFYVMRYEAVVGSYLGETAAHLNEVFEFVRTQPCVLFLDEFDAIAKERGDAHETGEIKRAVTSLLLQIDRLPSYVVVVAATNHQELLDRAVWRRFQIALELPKPKASEFKKYLERFLLSCYKSPGFSAERLLKAVSFESYSAVEEFCLDVRRRHALSLGEKPIKKAIEEVQRSWQGRSRPPG